MPIETDIDRITVIAPNFKQRLSGVTSTIVQLLPAQRNKGRIIAAMGWGLPDFLPAFRKRAFWKLWKRPLDGKPRIWHARRNNEMLAGIFMRDIFRMPLKLLFTSAAQRDHKRFTKWLIRRMDAVIATSEKSGSFLKVPFTVVTHGVNTEAFKPTADKAQAKQRLGLDPNRKIIGCTGRVRHSKGTDIAVYAMLNCLEELPDWDLIITGRATQENQSFKQDLLRSISAKNAEERIKFVGEVDDVIPWYQAFDIFLATSRNEGFGLTPLEAMASGVPCITSTAGYYAQMMREGKTGYVISADDPKLWSEQILRLAKNHELRSEMGETARNHVLDAHALEGEVIALETVYDALRNSN